MDSSRDPIDRIVDQMTSSSMSHYQFVSEKSSVLEVMLSALPKANLIQIQRAQRWFEELEKSERAISLMEHNALMLLVQKQAFQKWHIENAEMRLKNVLLKNLKLLLKTDSSDLNPLMRLPKSVLRKYSHEDILFHQALFHEDKRNGFFASLKVVLVDYIPRLQDLSIPVIIAVFMLISNGVEILSGLVVGYLLSTLMEYVVHLYIAHATPAIKTRLRTWGKIGDDMMRFSVEHSVHHGSVSKNYVDPFAPEEGSGSTYSEQKMATKEKIDQALLKRGGERLLTLVQQSQYGLSSSNILRTHLFFLPFSVLVVALGLTLAGLFGLGWGFPFALSVILAGELWISTSAIYHPMLHHTRQHIDETQGVVLRTILRTRISSFIARSHRMHHHKGGWVNQNLNPGADFLFGFTPISIEELIDMKKRDAPF